MYERHNILRDITFQDCVEFQDCFLFDGKFSPFENIDNFQTYFPRVLIGEIGGLLNLSCKSERSPNIYDDEIKDECADIFIYLLLFGRMIEMHQGKKVFGSIAENWSDSQTTRLKTEDDFYDQCMKMLKMVLCFLEPGSVTFYNERHFYEIFSTLREVSNYKTKLSWQQVINSFHQYVIHRHTNPITFTPEGLYKGSFQINIDNLLRLIDHIDLELPKKRVDFLKRMKAVQLAVIQFESSSNGHDFEQRLAAKSY